MEDYQLVLRPTLEDQDPLDQTLLRERLLRIPGVIARGDGVFQFGEIDEHGAMIIQARDESIETAIPRAWVHERGPQVFAIVFMMAEWHAYEVYDPQIGEVLIKEAVLQGLVAMRQARLEAEGRGGPPGTRAHFVDPPQED